MACNLVVVVCVSRWDMSAGSSVDSRREVSWNGSICTVSRLDAEPAAAVASEADPLGTLNYWIPDTRYGPSLSQNCLWSISASLLAVVPSGPTSCEWPLRRVCAGSETIFDRHLCPYSPHKTYSTQLSSLTYLCSPLNACCREFHCHTKSPLISAPQHWIEQWVSCFFISPSLSIHVALPWMTCPCPWFCPCPSVSPQQCVLINWIRILLCLKRNVTLFCIQHLQILR